MSEDFGEQFFLYNQTEILRIPTLESLGVSGVDPNRRGELNIYVRCQDQSGNFDVAEKVIQICVKPSNDLSPPIISRGTPRSENIKIGSTRKNISVFTSEPADCKWSLSDKLYSSMENNFLCANDIDEQTFFGWQCFTEVPIVQNTTIIKVRCLDQPWLEEQNKSEKRNANTQSINFTLKQSSQILKIDSLSPNNQTLSFKTEPATVSITLKTSGGVDGNADCSYKFGDKYQLFTETFGKNHKVSFNQFTRGEMLVPIQCVDSAGNVAEATAKFTIEIDESPPLVTRAYIQSGSLVIITNEDSQCGFTTTERAKGSSCNFDLAESTLFSGAEKHHSTSLIPGKVYHIKCEDKFKNSPGSCNIVVKEGF